MPGSPVVGPRVGGRIPVFGEPLAKVSITAINRQGLVESIGTLQFWPETLSESNGAEYADRTVPGGSHPIYQWISGTARQFSFTAQFRQEQRLTGGFPISLAGVADPKRSADIPGAIAWLRSLLLPKYQNLDFAEAPPKLLIVFPNMRLRDGFTDTLEALMTNLEIEWMDWWPDGTPREADASITFVEIVQSAFGSVKYRDRTELFRGMGGYAGMSQQADVSALNAALRAGGA